MRLSFESMWVTSNRFRVKARLYVSYVSFEWDIFTVSFKFYFPLQPVVSLVFLLDTNVLSRKEKKKKKSVKGTSFCLMHLKQTSHYKAAPKRKMAW